MHSLSMRGGRRNAQPEGTRARLDLPTVDSLGAQWGCMGVHGCTGLMKAAVPSQLQQ